LEIAVIYCLYDQFYPL